MARAIRAACTGPGFFYFVNHRFPQAVIARSQAAMQRFFALPVAHKMRNHHLDWPNHRGYVPSGGISADHSLDGSSDISEAIEMAYDPPAHNPAAVDILATRSLSRYNKDLYRSKSNPDQIVQHTNSLKDSHTDASHAVMNGVPVPVVSRMLGHSNGPHDAALRPSRRPGNPGCRRADRAMGRSQHGHGRVGGVVTELLHQILLFGGGV